MKWEKRDITLNEADSFRDMLYMQKCVYLEYMRALETPLKKQTQNVLVDALGEVAVELCDIRTHLEGILEQGEKKQ